MTFRSLARYWLVALAALLAGCAATGSNMTSTGSKAEGPKLVGIQAPLGAPWLQFVEAALRDRGFQTSYVPPGPESAAGSSARYILTVDATYVGIRCMPGGFMFSDFNARLWDRQQNATIFSIHTAGLSESCLPPGSIFGDLALAVEGHWGGGDFQTIVSFCEQLFQDPTLTPISDKLMPGRRPDLAHLVNSDKVTDEERPLLLRYAEKAQACDDRVYAWRISSGAPQALITIWDAERNARTRNLVDLYERRVTYGEYLQRRTDIIDKRNADIAVIEQQLGQQTLEARQKAQELANQRAMAYAALLSATKPPPPPSPPVQYVVPLRQSIHTTCNQVGSYTYCDTH